MGVYSSLYKHVDLAARLHNTAVVNIFRSKSSSSVVDVYLDELAPYTPTTVRCSLAKNQTNKQIIVCCISMPGRMHRHSTKAATTR